MRFLRTERLSQELADLLQEQSFPVADTRFILEMPKVNTSKRARVESYYTPELREEFMDREWLLFMLYSNLVEEGMVIRV